MIRIVTVGAGASAAAADRLASAFGVAGLAVASRVFVEEDETALEEVLGREAALTVVVAGASGSGGDAVRRTIARLTGTRLALNERALAALEAHHQALDRPLPRRDERLAVLPLGAVVWSAAAAEPAWALDSPRGAFVVLGRAASTEVIDEIVQFARGRAGVGAVLTRTLRTAGVTATELEERLAAFLGKAGDVTVSVTPAESEVWVRLRAKAATIDEAERAIAAAEPTIAATLGEDLYGRDDETLERAVGRLLLGRRLTVAVAESCTGGLVGHRLTNVPGSSAYFERGVMVYSNRAKQELLGVPEDVLRTHGAVSAACAETMARGIVERSGSGCGLAVTGIAGPDGGSPAKPVGTVFVGLSVGGTVSSRHFRFVGDRGTIKWLSSQMALDMLRRALIKEGR